MLGYILLGRSLKGDYQSDELVRQTTTTYCLGDRDVEAPHLIVPAVVDKPCVHSLDFLLVIVHGATIVILSLKERQC